MSFANLRAARAHKDQRSYANTASASLTTAASPSPVEGSEKGDGCSQAVPLDGLYQSLPSSVEVRTSAKSGRGIWSKASFNAGSIFLSLKPPVAVLSNQYLDSHCSCCFGNTASSGLKRCTQCRTVRYCDSACQNKDWSMHKYECEALRRWAKTAPPDRAVPGEATRCQGRMLWKRRKQGPESVWSREVEKLQSHRSSLPPSLYEAYVHVAHTLVRYLGMTSPEQHEEFGLRSARDLVDFLSRFNANAITLASPSLTPIGVTVSPVVALINHSCDPNAVVVFPRATANSAESLMQVVTLRTIGPDEEILTSYIDTTTSRESRGKLLQETYNFVCDCHLCRTPPIPDPRESMWCPKLCGGTCTLPTGDGSRSTRCGKCHALVSDTAEISDALRIGEEALAKATSLQSKAPADARRITTNMIPVLTRAGLLPSSYPLLAMNRLHQSLLISSLTTQELLDETILTATKSAEALSAILCYGHPVRGVALAELGKLLAVDELSPHLPTNDDDPRFPPSGAPRLKLAYETLLKARKELLVGFGVVNDGGQVGKEVRETLISLEKEMGIWNQGVRNVLEDTVHSKRQWQSKKQ